MNPKFEETPEVLKSAIIERNLWLINITDFDEDSVDLWFCMCQVNDNDKPVRICLPGVHATELPPGTVHGLVSMGDRERDYKVFRRWLENNLEDFPFLEGLLDHLNKTLPSDEEEEP
jgi:hypothetical protein